MLGHAYAVPMRLSNGEGPDNTSAFADGATGGTSSSLADEIWAWVQQFDDSDGYREAWLLDMDGGGPFPDGTWVEDLDVTTLQLEPGMGWWYRSRGAVLWKWDIPVPY